MSGNRFERAPVAVASQLILDAVQRSVVDLADGLSASVLGAPGSGKTTTIIELVADRVAPAAEGGRGWSPDSLLVLASSRAAATRLRDRLALRVGAPTNGPLARTATSLAFELVGAAARAAGTEPPRLVTAAEQDADIAAILEGHRESGGGPAWPEMLDPAVRRLRGFRTELRELMARATEYDVSPQGLRELGRASGRESWVAAADFFEEYLTIVASSRSTQLDPAELARFAVEAVHHGRSDDRVARLRLVIVDDLQEATESTLALLRALTGRGVAVIAFGDPDVAANAFRGGEPDALGRLSVVLGNPQLQQFVLPQVYRQRPALRALTSAVTARIGTAAAGTQRAARAAGAASEAAPPPLARIEATSPAREWAAVARLLREEHLARDIPWSRLAVIVRSSAHAPGIARALALAEVPTRTASGGVALRDETAARSLLALVEVGVGRTELTAELAAELLLSPFGGLDALALRRLRLALRAEELAGDGNRVSDVLLVEALSAPGRFVTIDSRPARYAEHLAETLEALRTSDGSIEDLLWLAWDRSRLAKPWHDQALGTGPVAAEANRNLDAVVALFSAAKRFAERRPDAPASEFLAEILDAEVPEDVLAPSGRDDAVLVTTPSGAVGLEFTTVVVAALQDGVWPNLRARGSLLQPQHLVRAVAGSGEGANSDAADRAIDDRKLVLDDELRMFALAVSRASERVVLAAVANDDEQRSMFFSLLPADAVLIDSSTKPPLSLRGFTGRLRRTLADPRSNRADAAAAASSLAALARLGLPGASPDDWHGLEPISSSGPLYEGSTIPVSPSRMERLEESPLDWFLETIAGGDSGVVAGVGTILHWAMETTDDPVVERLWAAVESRWGELVFESPWLAERQRRLARIFTEGLAEYLQDFERDGKSLVAAEGRFALEFGELEGVPNGEPRDDGAPRPAIVVNGSIDRVERGVDGSVVIVDLKTGRPITSSAAIAAHPQLGAYQLAYAEGKFDEPLAAHGEHAQGGAKLVYVREGKDGRRYRDGHQALLDAEQLEAVRERIRQAAVLIAAAEFDGKLELEQYGGFGATPRLRLHRVTAVSSD